MLQTVLWIAFGAVVLTILILDLAVVHRRPHKVGVREASLWSAFCIGVALLFNVAVSLTRGKDVGFAFLSAYLTEEALSIDNLFVFLLIFSYFKVPGDVQHRVLFWGVMGALVFRGIAIGIGVVLIRRFHFILYVFGAVLVWTGFKFLVGKEEQTDPGKNIAVRFVRRFFKVTEGFRGKSFFVTENGSRYATPLFVVLLVVETSDIIFAVDSIPAVFGLTQDPFIAYTSNVFAILGLRSLYAVLAHMLVRLRFLRFGLAFILFFVGLKMLFESLLKVPIEVSLGVIAGVLAITALASWLAPGKHLESSPLDVQQPVGDRGDPPAAVT